MNILDGEILAPGSQLGSGAATVIKQRTATSPVKKVRKQNFTNRHTISPVQHQILNLLAAAGQPVGDRIGHLPRTGDIVDALGLPRTKSAFASVSRSLSRLVTAGKVIGYEPSITTRGKGRHYGLKP